MEDEEVPRVDGIAYSALRRADRVKSPIELVVGQRGAEVSNFESDSPLLQIPMGRESPEYWLT